MSNFTIPFCLLCLLLASCSPKTTAPTVTAPPPVIDSTIQADSLVFPEDWAGIWAGELSIYNAKGLARKIPMELQVLPSDSVGQYEWTLIYGPDKTAGARPYLLKTIDREKGLYVVDERNSISLECYLLNNKLYSWYLVQKSLILVTYEVVDGQMHFEVIAGSNEPISITGGEKVDEEDIPEVSTYPINVAQKGLLLRRK